MTKEQLLDKRSEVEKKFNELAGELARLQGEYRLLTDMLKELEPEEAGSVDVEPTLKKEDLKNANPSKA